MTQKGDAMRGAQYYHYCPIQDVQVYNGSAIKNSSGDVADQYRSESYSVGR